MSKKDDLSGTITKMGVHTPPHIRLEYEDRLAECKKIISTVLEFLNDPLIPSSFFEQSTINTLMLRLELIVSQKMEVKNVKLGIRVINEIIKLLNPNYRATRNTSLQILGNILPSITIQNLQIDRIYKHIKNDQILSALEVLEFQTKETNQEIHQMVLLNMARLKSIEKKYLTGQLSDENHRVERMKIGKIVYELAQFLGRK